jgi:hypothetical protein
MNAPAMFPPLPPSLEPSANIEAAHRVLTDIYRHASVLLQQEDADPLRIAFHVDSITSDAIPVLCAMEREGGSEHSPTRLPEEWLQAGAQVLGELVVALQRKNGLARERFVRCLLSVSRRSR